MDRATDNAQTEAEPLANPPNPTTANRDKDGPPISSFKSGNSPTRSGAVSAGRLAHAASATNSDTNSIPDMATAISQYMEEKAAVPSFHRVEKISGTLVPLRTQLGRQNWTVRYLLWLQDQKTRTAVSTERTCSDSGEAHENPWKPCQPSEDAKEWNGVEELDGVPPGVAFDCPATPPVADSPAVTDVGRTE